MQDRGGRLPEPIGDDVGGGVLDRQLEVGRRRRRQGVGGGRVGWACEARFGGRRGDGEAAGLGNAWHEDVEPLAGEEAHGSTAGWDTEAEGSDGGVDLVDVAEDDFVERLGGVLAGAR